MEAPVKFTAISHEIDLPKRATKHSAGYDIATPYDFTIKPQGRHKVSTLIKAEIREGLFGMLVIRSSLGIKKNIVLANQVGIIDADYRGEIIMALRNVGDEIVQFSKGDRLGQLVIIPYHYADATLRERGEGGLGSTGS